MAHALHTLLEAAAEIGRGPQRTNIRLLFLGDGAAKPQLQAEAKRLGLRNVLFIDTVPKAEVARYWSLLDLSIIHLKRTELFTTVIPSKLFECMAMGIPVLHGVAGESAEIVEREGVGLTFEPENSAELTEKIRLLAQDQEARRKFSLRGARAAQHYDRAYLAASMLAVLEQTASRTAKLASPESTGPIL
jgi:glycosyltransferase involved in cell wall biosynthesis